MNKDKKIYLFFYLLFLFLSSANCQISISDIGNIEEIKNGVTYIAMKDPLSEKAKAFVEVYKTNWNFSKIEFIKYSEIEKYLAPNNSFLTIGGYETERSFTDLTTGMPSKLGINYSNTHLYLEFWYCNEKYFKKEKSKRELKNKYKNQIARIELFTDFSTLSNPKQIYSVDYDGNGHIYNWSPGILKNYLQFLCKFLDKKEERKLFDEIIDKEKIGLLQDQKLYVPSYTLTKFNKFTGDESKKHDEADIYGDYKFKYELISTEKLNEKIQTSSESFYYLIYIKSSTDKYVSIIDSKSGDMIYSVYKPVEYNIKSKDIKKLQVAIEKRKL